MGRTQKTCLGEADIRTSQRSPFLQEGGARARGQQRAAPLQWHSGCTLGASLAATAHTCSPLPTEMLSQTLPCPWLRVRLLHPAMPPQHKLHFSAGGARGAFYTASSLCY